MEDVGGATILTAEDDGREKKAIVVVEVEQAVGVERDVGDGQTPHKVSTLGASERCISLPDHHLLRDPAMSALARDAAAFKSALHRQDYTSWHSQPPPLREAGDAGEPGPSTSSAGGKKKKRPKTST